MRKVDVKKFADVHAKLSPSLSTLAFLLRDENILLAMKKRGFGVGKWNGAGGKPEKGESVEDAFLRELREEIGVNAVRYEKRGVLHFYDTHTVENNFIVHVFIVHTWEGIEQETEEMRPQWFETCNIPYSDMWPDDKFWLPSVLSGKTIEAHFLFDENTQIAEHEIFEGTV